MNQNTEQLLFSPNSAARALDISRTKMYGLMRDGIVRFVLIGADRRIPASELHRLAAEGIPQARAAA
jgi:excisionase family DNA binding protein